jgi:hypothetical protein
MHKKAFTPNNTAMLLTDHQVGTMAWTHPCEKECATASEDRQGMSRQQPAALRPHTHSLVEHKPIAN